MKPTAKPAPGESNRGVVGSSTITRKSQVTIPKKARERFNLQEGDLIMFIEEAGRLYLVKGTNVGFIPAESKSDYDPNAKPYFR